MNHPSPIQIDNEQLVREVYDTYYHRLCFYARRFITDIDAAQDVVQDVLVNIWVKTMSFNDKSALQSFLYISVYNACMNVLKNESMKKRHLAILSEYAEPDKDFVTSCIEEEVYWEIARAIEQLPEACKNVFKMSYIENNDVETVAQILQISPRTVKSLRQRSKQLLKEKLKHLYLFVSIIIS